MKKLLVMGGALVFACNTWASAPVEGTWYLQDKENTQAKLDKAVEESAKKINFFIRALARPVLEKEAKICETWGLSSNDTHFIWQCGDNEASELVLSANKSKTLSDDGREILGTLKRTEEATVVVLESDRGKRTNEWIMVNDNELEYTATLESSKLPKPLSWTLTYTRTP